MTGYRRQNGCRMCIRAGRPRIHYIAGGVSPPRSGSSQAGGLRCESSPWAMAARVLVDASRHRLTAGGQRAAALWRMARAAIDRLGWGVAGQALSSISAGAAATAGLAAAACGRRFLPGSPRHLLTPAAVTPTALVKILFRLNALAELPRSAGWGILGPLVPPV
jgi:hypothetical protein